MIDKIKSTINKYNMLCGASKVVAAVSGGSDSMALLFALKSIKDEYGFELCAAHVNHCIRGEDAERDEAFVRSKCNELGVEIYVKKADVIKMASEQGIGLEECGRNVRYDFFNSLGDNVVIATAHNLSDRAETFLFNFARGSALRGLCSIPPVRDNIVRPLIECSKEEILDFCEKNNIEYVSDITNDDVKYSRNRIRHNVVSELCKINPSFEKCAGRCIDSVNEDEIFLSSLAEEAIKNASVKNGYDAAVISQLPIPIKKRAIVGIIEKSTKITVESKFINNICDMLISGGSMQINGGVTVRVRKGIVDFPLYNNETPVSQQLEKTNKFGDAVISSVRYENSETDNLQIVSEYGLEYYLDCDKICGKVIIRSRQDGDKITLASRKCTKSLKKLFNELAVPPEKRSSVAVFADDSGVILVEGSGVDQRVAVGKNTRNVLKIRIER